MATLQNIFFKPSRGYKEYDTDDDTLSTVIDTLYRLDGVIKEQHTATARVTKNPVEFGVDITDHVIVQPQRVVIEGIVTNSPSLKQITNRLPGDPDTVKSTITEIATQSRARNAYKGLKELQNRRRPVQLQTGLLQYDNMILTSLSAPSDVQNNLRVRLVFDEIFIVDSDTSEVTMAVTSEPTDLDLATAISSLVEVGVAGVQFALASS